jgi:hypothetical protein
MIELIGLYHISDGYNNLVIYLNESGNEVLGSEYNNEYFQAIRQGYDFTCIDHIYQKNGKKYKYNNQTLKFDENYELMTCDNNNKNECIIGEDEKCKTCDLNQIELCGTCNNGYYLPEEDKTKCKKCSMDCCKECPNDKCILCSGEDVKYPELTLEDALKKVMEEDVTPESYSKNIYYSNFYPSISIRVKSRYGSYTYTVNGKKHFVFHTYKRKMIELNGLYHILSNYDTLNVCIDIENRICNTISGSEYNNEYFQSVRQGYDFTCIDHIYQKNDKKYKYNDKTLNFDEVAADELTCKNECTTGENEKCN